MKLQVKTLNQKSLLVDINETQTVYDLKKELSLYPDIGVQPEQQKLIYAGKILEDNEQISDCKIDTKKFVVVMILKQPVPIDAAATSAAIVSTTSSEKADATKPAEGAATTSTGTTSSETPKAAPPKSENDEMIENIVAMGYPESEVRRALAASYNNPERAIEYLIEGIPAAASLPEAPEYADEDTELTPLELLRSDPQFRQLRRAIHQHPEFLDEAIQQLGEANPELITLINENQQEFVAMLLEGSESDDSEEENAGQF